MKRFFVGTTFALLITAFAILFVALPIVLANSLPREVRLTESEFEQSSPLYLPRTPFLNQETNTTFTVDSEPNRYIDLKLFGLITIRRVKVDILPFNSVIPGGTLVGFNAKIDGVVVTVDSGVLKKGDIIAALDNERVRSIENFNELIETGGNFTATIRRGESILDAKLEKKDGSFNIWLKDETSGVGTLTYVNPQNNNFASLGHRMTDFETGAKVDLRGGTVMGTTIVGVEKSNGKKIGVYKSALDSTNKHGEITSSSNYGVFGCLFVDSELAIGNSIPVASRYNVKPGKAKLRTTTPSGAVREISCEIVKTRFQKTPNNKSMIIRITDRDFISQTGGIIHGMSGSPIIQNGKVVGALTHVVQGDPTKGYGVYIDFIMQ